MTITVEAPAKVNLTLHVVGRRPDGYHLLDSLVAFAGIGDTVEVEPAPDLRLTVGGPTAYLLPADGDNIVLRAARALAGRLRREPAAAIRLTKRLPVAAGIGGGSADAAATLRALARLLDADLHEADWTTLALGLGADVPVCLRGRPARMSGIGERLAAVPPLPPAWLVLANPMVPLATPPVFKARTGPFSAAAPLDQPPVDAAALALALSARRNDLTDAARSLAPVIGEVLSALTTSPACLLARMSGSGATCFGLFATETDAAQAAAGLAREHPGWWSAAAPLLG